MSDDIKLATIKYTLHIAVEEFNIKLYQKTLNYRILTTITNGANFNTPISDIFMCCAQHFGKAAQQFVKLAQQIFVTGTAQKC